MLSSSVFALGVLDLALFRVRGIHVALGDSRDDLLPRFVRFPWILLFQSRDDERSDGRVARVVVVDDRTVLPTALADGEGFRPLPIYRIQYILLLAGGI